MERVNKVRPTSKQGDLSDNSGNEMVDFIQELYLRKTGNSSNPKSTFDPKCAKEFVIDSVMFLK